MASSVSTLFGQALSVASLDFTSLFGGLLYDNSTSVGVKITATDGVIRLLHVHLHRSATSNLSLSFEISGRKILKLSQIV